MSNKLLAGLLVGATFLATSLNAPVEARNNNYQNMLNAEAMQMYQQNLMNQQYGYGSYGYGLPPGISPNDPLAFQKAQYYQWLSTQGGNAGYSHQGFINSPYYSNRFNPQWGGWNGHYGWRKH
ncbi:MAG TPA: hypothetical protein V6C76_03230 [Drouetiella sp.]